MREVIEQYGEMVLEILGTGIVVGILSGFLCAGGSFLDFVYKISQLAC